MNVRTTIAVTLLGLVAGVGCSSGGDAEPRTGTTEKPSLKVDNLDPAACEAYAAKQSRLNPGGPAWTFRMDGTTCVVTQG